jgi:hypothetical protein
VYSLRDTNLHRASQGRGPVEIGVNFYGREPAETSGPG